MDIIPQVEKIVDAICEKGYSSIFYIGIGGTVLYASQMMHIVKQLGAKVPLYVENAADFNLVGNPFFDKDSVVVIESISGDTKEVVETVKKAHEAGARVIGYVEKPGTCLLYTSFAGLIGGKLDLDRLRGHGIDVGHVGKQQGGVGGLRVGK